MQPRGLCGRRSLATFAAVVGLLPAVGATAQASSLRWPGVTARRIHAENPWSGGWLHRAATARGRLARRSGGRRERARAAIVGGTEISVESAPWQVVVLQKIPLGNEEFEVALCGGAILDETRILTAAHCVVNPITEAGATSENMRVIAGTSDIERKEAGEQKAEVQQVRVHPYFEYAAGPGTPDDVAVLTLAQPLDLAGTRARAIGEVGAGVETPEGSAVRLSGFGEENPATEELTGQLHSLGMGVVYSRECGGEGDALFLCASAPGGSACSGDSGSGLTSGGVAVGVTDTVEVKAGQRCTDGAIAGFVNLAAPEIADFVEGSESPPHAPRGGGAVIRGVPSVGHSLTCEAGSWSDAPTFSYAFLDGEGGQALQQGPASTYALSAADVGRRILCEVRAANAGGTGVGRTPPLEAIKAVPGAGPTPLYPSLLPKTQPPSPPASPAPHETHQTAGVTLKGATLPVSGGFASAVLDCGTSGGCRGKLTLTVRVTSNSKGHRHTHTVTIATASFSIHGGAATVKLALDARGRALLNAHRRSLSAHLTIQQLAPAPAQSHTTSVQLVQHAARQRGSGHRR